MAKQGRLRTFFINLALFLGALVLMGALSEAALRLFSPQHQTTGYTPDARLLWRGRPGATVPGGQHRNTLGFFDVEHRREKPPGTRRVLVLGDSFMEGLGVELEASFCRRLESLLNQKGEKWEVINGAIGGWGPDQEYLYLLDEGLAYGPDFVVAGFFLGNDVLDLGRKDMIRFQRGRAYAKTRGQLNWLVKLKGFLQNHSHLYVFVQKRLLAWDFTRNLLARLGLTSESSSAVKTVRVRSDKKPLPNRLIMLLKDRPPSIRAAWLKTEKLLAAMRSLGEEKGFRLLIAAIPSRIQIDSAYMESVAARYKVAPEELDPGLPNRLLREICRRNKIQLLDLGEVFGDTRGTSMYHAGSLHWSREGHERASAAVAVEIARMGDARPR